MSDAGTADRLPPAGPIALLEVIDRDGRVRHVRPVAQWPVTIGRAIDNDLVLDDPHVAAYHARLEPPAEGAAAVPLLALPSLNGLALGRRRVKAGERLYWAGGDTPLVVGTSRLRLRLAGEALAPERPLAPGPNHGATIAVLLVLWAWVLAEHALRLDPGAKASDWIMPVLGVPVLIGAWCSAWALVSKVFQGRFEFWPHLAVAVRGLLAIEIAGLVLPWASALTGWSGPSRVAGGVGAAIAVATLLGHGRIVLPGHRRALGITATAAFVAGAGLLLALNHQRSDRWFSELYVATLPPPALVFQRGVEPAAFVDDAARAKARLEAAVREAEAERAAGRDVDDD